MKLSLSFLLLIFQSAVFGQVSLPDTVRSELRQLREIENRGEFEIAIEKEEIALVKYIDYPEFQGYFFLRLGSTFCLAKKCKLGLNYFIKAIANGVLFRDTVLLGQGYMGLGSAYQFLHFNDSAYSNYNKARPYLMAKRDTIQLIGIESNIALLVENYKDRESRNKLVIDIREGLNDTVGIIGGYYNLGMLYFEHKLYRKSFDMFLISHELANVTAYRNDLIKAKRGLALSTYRLGDLEKAFSYFLEYDSAASKWLYSEDYNDKILELETKYNTAEIQRQNEIKETKIQESRLKLTILSFAILLGLLLGLIGYFLLDQRRKHLKQRAEIRAEAADKKIAELLQTQEMKTAYALLEGQDLERKRISSELHDNLGNLLVTSGMFSDTIVKRINSDHELMDVISKMSLTIKQAIEEVRKISHHLDSGLLNHFGIETAVSQLLEAVESSKQIKTALVFKMEGGVSNSLGKQLYRIIQELITNSLKHSFCNNIRLELTEIEKEVTMIYEDDGRGFDLLKVKPGIGLNNIYKRVEKFDGDLKMDALPGRGCTVIIQLSLV